ncbi:hypothetical protein AMTRI_Chr06g177920 [Amborella trichopoda]
MNSGSGSPSSSPPTPPSPLPISVGPNHEKYIFSLSPWSSPSPPFSPTSGPLSSESDSRVPEYRVLLPRGSLAPPPPRSSTFSLDRLTDFSTAPNSCFWNCLEWILTRCCCGLCFEISPHNEKVE